MIPVAAAFANKAFIKYPPGKHVCAEYIYISNGKHNYFIFPGSNGLSNDSSFHPNH